MLDIMVNRVFLSETYVKYGSARNCQRKFPRNAVPSIRVIHELVNKFRSTGSFLDKKLLTKLADLCNGEVLRFL
jgi:hypothetical protein